MKMKYCWASYTVVILSLMGAGSKVSSQDFASTILEQTAHQLQLSRLDTLPDGLSSIDLPSVRLTIKKHHNRIDHIGRQLFSPQLRMADPLPVYDYLEFAFLEQSVLKSDNSLRYKDVWFSEGSWEDMISIDQQTPCTISISDGRHYEVIWEGNKRVSVNFPVSYEIISTASRSELESNFITDLRHHHKKVTEFESISTDSSFLTYTDAIRYLPGEKYLLPSINNNTYYYNNVEGVQLVCDTLSAVETLANAICASDADWPQWVVEGLFLLHNNQQEALDIPLTDLADFCRNLGCQLFWGLEEKSDEKISGTMFAYNFAAGYNHVIRLEYPLHQQAERQYIRANISLFIPVTNIKNLHREYNPKKQKINWQ